MNSLEWFRQKLLEMFAQQKECFRNIFQPHGHYLKSWLEKDPSEPEIQLAQKAFRSLVDDGLIYDVTGDGWHTITEDGRRALKSRKLLPSSLSFEDFLKKYALHPKIKEVSAKLFGENNYKEAIQAALVEVITRVKGAAGKPKDLADYSGSAKLDQKPTPVKI